MPRLEIWHEYLLSVTCIVSLPFPRGVDEVVGSYTFCGLVLLPDA